MVSPVGVKEPLFRILSLSLKDDGGINNDREPPTGSHHSHCPKFGNDAVQGGVSEQGGTSAGGYHPKSGPPRTTLQ